MEHVQILDLMPQSAAVSYPQVIRQLSPENSEKASRARKAGKAGPAPVGPVGWAGSDRPSQSRGWDRGTRTDGSGPTHEARSVAGRAGCWSCASRPRAVAVPTRARARPGAHAPFSDSEWRASPSPNLRPAQARSIRRRHSFARPVGQGPRWGESSPWPPAETRASAPSGPPSHGCSRDDAARAVLPVRSCEGTIRRSETGTRV